jgi:hypothetical protein
VNYVGHAETAFGILELLCLLPRNLKWYEHDQVQVRVENLPWPAKEPPHGP